MGVRAVVSAVCALLLGVSVASTARAEDVKRACVDSHERAQIDEKAGRLREARTQLLACAGDVCPGLVRSDCARLLAQLSERVPSVVVDARDATGAETTDVRMYVDDELVASSLNGTAVELDPGPHTLRFETHARKKEQRIVVKEGEKRRRVTVAFTPDTVRSPAAREAPSRSAWPWIFGGIAAAAVASFGTFAIVGYASEKHLSSTCAPGCSSEAVKPIKTEYFVADLSLGVAIVSLAATLVSSWALAPRGPTETALRW